MFWGLIAMGLIQSATPPEPDYPPLPAVVRDESAWIAPGWERVTEARGDLNGDGRPDVALVTWPKGEFDRRNSDVSLHNYRLLVGFGSPSGGYQLSVDNKALLRAPIAMDDGPLDADSVEAVKGILKLSHWLLRGHEVHTLRWDGNDFRLIGYDLDISDGSCTRSVSINFLSRRATVETAGLDEAAEERSFKRRVTRGPATLAAASADDFYPESLLAGPPTYCIRDGKRW